MQVGPINVLFMIPTLRGGGAERVIVTLLNHLDRSKFRLVLAVVDIEGAVYLDHLPSDVEFIDLDCRRVLYALPKILNLIWKRRPDVVFSTLGHLNLAVAIMRPFLPNGVCYIARETIVVSKSLETVASPGVWVWLYRKFYKRHDWLVCQSCDMRLDLIERFGFPPEKTVIINNPVDVECIRNLALKPLNHLRLPNDGIQLVAAGRLSKQKGYDIMIEALALLGNPRIQLCILGEGGMQADLKALAVARNVADQIVFVGFQQNPYSWFAQADAFLLSSRYEGFPNVVLEALACGTPVIATPAPGGVREILDGIDGCVVAREVSAISLANAISTWLAKPKSRISLSAVDPYRAESIVGRYETLLLNPRNRDVISK